MNLNLQEYLQNQKRFPNSMKIEYWEKYVKLDTQYVRDQRFYYYNKFLNTRWPTSICIALLYIMHYGVLAFNIQKTNSSKEYKFLRGINQHNNSKYNSKKGATLVNFFSCFNLNCNQIGSRRSYSTFANHLDHHQNNVSSNREIKIDINEVINYLNSYWVQNYECGEDGSVCLVKDEYRGVRMDNSFGVTCLKEDESLDNLLINERRKLEKISYLFNLPLHEELVNNFPFFLGEYSFFYFYIDLSTNERYTTGTYSRTAQLHLLLSYYKDLIFNYQHLTSIKSYGDGENENSSLFEQNQTTIIEMVLCFSKEADKADFLNDFHKKLKEFFEYNKKDLINQEYELIELVKPQDFFIFFKREYIFKKYPFEFFLYNSSRNSFFIYVFRIDLLPYYHLLGFNCRNDDADFLNMDVCDYCKENGFIYDYRESIIKELDQIDEMMKFISFIDFFVYIPYFYRSLNENGDEK